MPRGTLEVYGQLDLAGAETAAAIGVAVWDAGLRHRAPLGHASVDASGEFRISLDEDKLEAIFGRRELELYFVVSQGDVIVFHTLFDLRWRREHVGTKRHIKRKPSPPTSPPPSDRAPQLQTISGRVVEDKTGTPLVGVTVRLVDNTSAVPLSATKSDASGAFQLVFSIAAGTTPALTVEVTARDGSRLASAAPPAKPGEPLLIRAAAPAAPAAPAPLISEVLRESGLVLSPTVASALATRNITTLADVRASGGLKDFATDPTARALVAHAALSTIQPDAKVNATLIERAFDSPIAIARAGRLAFVGKVRDALGYYGAMRAYALAHTQASYLNQAVFAMSADAANGAPVPQDFAVTLGQNGLTSPVCACDDCEAGTSPAAYLADLLDFAAQHLVDTTTGGNVSLESLSDLFLEPFADLIPACDEVQRKVRQVRICIEVLRRALAKQGVAQPVAGESDYLLEAYRALLVQIGTNVDEVRAARVASNEERAALAARLGFSLTAPRPTGGDELDALLLRPGTVNALNDKALEVLFGLQDTNRDPLSTGIKDNDPQGQIAHFSLDSVEYRVSTDDDGLVYANVYRTSEPAYHVDLYRDAARTQLVAQGTTTDPNGTVVAMARNGANLEGRFRIHYTADNNAVVLRALPRLVAFRSREARRFWEIEDRPYDSFLNVDPTADPRDQLPVIDPDVVGPDDFRLPFEKANATDPDGPFDIWRRRRDWVDARLAAFQLLRTPPPPAAFTPQWPSLFAAMQQNISYGSASSAPWPATLPGGAAFTDASLDALAGDLNDSTRSNAAKTTILNTMHLSLDAFSRLLSVRGKDKIGQALKDTDWSDIVSILAQVQKTAFFDAWIAEEKTTDPSGNPLVELGPQQFWVSQRAPKPGDWPPLPAAAAPLIDPSLKLDDLPEQTAGRRAIALCQARQVEMDALVAALRSANQSSTPGQAFEVLFTLALGAAPAPAPAPPPTWSAYLTTVYSNFTDGINGAAAQTALDTVLHMSGDALTRLIALKARYDDTSPQALPLSLSEWEEIYAILANAQKVAAKYPTWIQQEVTLGFQTMGAGTPVPLYWRAFKAKLAPWRAPMDVRADWERALAQWSAPPVIDPDLITTGHLRNPTPPDLAYARFAARLSDLTAQKATLDALVPSASSEQQPGFDEMLVASLVGDWPSGSTFIARTIAQIASDRVANGANGISFVLDQVFGPDRPDFNQLNTDLGGANANAATRTIVERLFLTIDSFNRIFAIINEANPPAADLDALDTALANAVAVGSVMGAALDEDDGNDITPRLAQLGLTPEAFDELRSHRLLASANLIDASEWGPIEDILVAARKRRRFATWRREEVANHLTIAPDWFRIPVPDPTVYPPVPLPPPATWRATASDRTDWEDTLQARIDTQQAIVDAVSSAVSDTEQNSLPDLRNTLIQAAGLAPRDVLTHYFIDGEMGGCQITTRVAQAIESVQAILFAARTGQLPSSFSNLALEDDSFDAEWNWIGSYATWRAAIFVVEYPQNLLVPTLRRMQTPAFRDLAQTLSSGRNVTPDLACEAAKTYSDYFADVLNMSTDASCQTTARVHLPERCRDERTKAVTDEFVVFQFGRGPVTGRPYWLLYAPDDPADVALGFWTVVPGFDDVTVVEVLGAVVYTTPIEHRRFLFVFLHCIEKGKQKVSYTRYDLEKAIWDQQPTDLDLPDKAVNWTAVVKQTASESTPPHLAFRIDDGRILDRRLSDDGSSWEQADFRLMIDPSEVLDCKALLAMVEYDENSFYVFLKGADTTIYSKLFHLFDVPVYRLSNNSFGNAHYFTTDPVERDAKVNNGYSYEGIAFRVGAQPRDGASALYRLSHEPKGQGTGVVSSFLVRRKDVRDNVIANPAFDPPYRDDGVLGYVYDSQVTGTSVLKFVYDASDDVHLATVSQDEYNAVTTRATNPFADESANPGLGTPYVTTPVWSSFDDGFDWLGAFSWGVRQGVYLMKQYHGLLPAWYLFTGADSYDHQLPTGPFLFVGSVSRHSGPAEADPGSGDGEPAGDVHYPGFIWNLSGFQGPFIARLHLNRGSIIRGESIRMAPMGVTGALQGVSLPGPAEISERFTDIERQARRMQIQAMYGANELLPTQTEGNKARVVKKPERLEIA